MHAFDRGSLAAEALDALELGIVVCTPALDQILVANESARRLLRELGTTMLDRGLRDAIASALEHPTLASAVRLALPSGRRLFVGTRRLRDAILVMVRGEVLREDDLFEVLRDRFDVSVRERQVIARLRSGHSNEQIGRELGISVGTVKQYLNRLFKTFGVHSRAELVALVEQIAREQRER